MLGIYLDLDGTFFVQLVVFWVVFGFLYFSVVRPYLDVVEEREEGIGGSKEDAAEMEARADELEQEYDEKLLQARREAQEVRESLRNQGKQTQNEKFEEVRQQLDGKIESERETIRQKVDEAQSEIESRAEELADAMVEKIVPGT
ncbi:MAG: ATP synthase F0 subunit B [Bradymonadaceae bacterium]